MVFSQAANQTIYPFVLPKLPYDDTSFSDMLSKETFDYHHQKHHNTYVEKLNTLLSTEPTWAGRSLEELILSTHGNKMLQGIFDNASQVWNHTFYWHSITSDYQLPYGELMTMLQRDFGSLAKFYTEFENAAMSQFGSGWVWLAYKNDKLHIIKTPNANNPITDDYLPLLTCDVWEHAYYIDYKNNRLAYVKAFLTWFANWNFASDNLTKAVTSKAISI